MWARTTATRPEPNSRPSSRIPSLDGKLTARECRFRGSSGSSDTDGDGLGGEDGLPAGPEVARVVVPGGGGSAAPPQAAADTAATTATTARAMGALVQRIAMVYASGGAGGSGGRGRPTVGVWPARGRDRLRGHPRRPGLPQ